MKLLTALVTLATVVHGFQPTARTPHNGLVHSSPSALRANSPTESTSPCDIPDMEIPQDVTAKSIRSAVLTNANGDQVRLGDQMGSGTSIVVFLRHLGCPYCWTFAREFSSVQLPEGVNGPLFVSIGDAEKLNVFLEKNPQVDPSKAFVDDYTFGAYAAAGFGRFDEQDQDKAKEAMKNMKAPNLGWKGAWDYATSVMKVSPVPDDMEFGQIPEGVLRLGGTFVINGDEIVYRWSDRVPGDHPDIDKVVSIAKQAAAKKKAGFQLASFFSL